MWVEINKRYFDDQFTALAEIDYLILSGSDGIGAHGMYSGNGKCIIIDTLFKFDGEAVRSGNLEEQFKFDLVYGLMMHEMLHQSVHEKAGRIIGGHGPAFLEEAKRVASLLEEPAPTPENVARWPLQPMVDVLTE